MQSDRTLWRAVSFAKGDEGFAFMEFAHDKRIIDQLSFHLRGNMMFFCIFIHDLGNLFHYSYF